MVTPFCKRLTGFLCCFVFTECFIYIWIQNNGAVFIDKLQYVNLSNGIALHYGSLINTSYTTIKSQELIVTDKELKKKNTKLKYVYVPYRNLSDTVTGLSHFNISLTDVYVSVKTSPKYYDRRLKLILQTWWNLGKQSIFFLSELSSKNKIWTKRTERHLIETKCGPGHTKESLCCKMSAEFDYLWKTSAKWWCHFDDDNYVNIPNLLKFLAQFNSSQDWYFGQFSRGSRQERTYTTTEGGKIRMSYWFASGGAGICVSRSLAVQMIPDTGEGRFVNACRAAGQSDDVSLAFVIAKLNVSLTVVPEFHSHYEILSKIKLLEKQISLSYRSTNVVNVVGFPKDKDPKRYLSLHCYLFPTENMCRALDKH